MHKIIALGLMSIFFFACSNTNDPTQAAYWIERLEDKKERINALKELGKIGDKAAIPAVLTWFDKKGLWQPEAAYALGQIGDESVIPHLVAGIDFTVGTGSDKRTRARNRTNINIAKSLVALKASQSAPALLRLLNTPDPAAKEAVTRALGRLNNNEATEPLIKMVSTESHPFLRKVAIQALGDLGDVKAVPVLVNSLYTELPGVSFYYEARYSLLQLGQASIPKLVETLKRQNKAVEAIRLPSGAAIADGAIEGKAAFVLGALQATETLPLLVDAMNKYYKLFQNRARSPIFASIPAAVAEIAYSLGTMGSPKAVPALLKLAADNDSGIRIAATEALATIGDPSAVAGLFKIATKGDAASQKAALTAISMLAGGEVLAKFDALGGGEDEASKKRATVIKTYRGRIEAAESCKTDTDCWKGKLSDSSALIRERAAMQLGWAKTKNAEAALLKAAEDDSAKVRNAAVHALGNLGKTDIALLKKIHKTWAKKIEYRDSNQNLKRLIARLSAKS